MSSYQTFKTGVKLGQGQTLGFTAGKGYYARTAPVSHPGMGEPPGLRPLTGGQIANLIAGYTNSLPGPMTDQQIQGRAQSMIDPIVQAITGRITAGEQAGAGAISGYASELARNLAPYANQARDIYSHAQQAQAAADAAESQAVSGNGQNLAGTLASDIAGMDGPAGLNGAVVAPLASQATGAGAALLGTGSSFLDQLIAQGASAENLAAKQPGIAGLRGLQDINNLSLASQKQLGDALSQEQQQVPGLVQNLETQSQNNQTNRASAAEKLREYYTARNDALNAGQNKNATAVTVANAKAAATVKAATIKARSAAEAAGAKASQTSFNNRIKFAKTYGYDPVTNEPLPGYTRDGSGHVVKDSSAKAAKQMSATQIAGLVQKWHDGKTQSTTQQAPQPDANGNPVYRTVKTQVGQVNYQQAYKLLRAYSVPDAQARAALNTVYGRGDTGRGWLTNEERAALGKAGRQTTVGTYQGHAFIGPNQVAALRKAGMLPPGEMVNGRYFIKPGG